MRGVESDKEKWEKERNKMTCVGVWELSSEKLEKDISFNENMSRMY